MLKRGGRRGGQLTGRRVRGGRPKYRQWPVRGGVWIVALSLLPVAAMPAMAAPPFAEHVSFGSLGGVGLVHMGNARFMGDGEIALGANFADPLGSAFLTWQATPWLEANLRYSQSFDLPDDLDRALDLKIRLVQESDYFPAVAVGLRDALGRGPWSGEYLALSKRFGPLDITLGTGWGAYAARNSLGNPLSSLKSAFDERQNGRSGVPAVKNFFRGDEMGFFGGIEYMTPIRGLSIKAEYDSSDMRGVTLAPALDKHRPFNLGLDYRPLPWLHLSVGYARGDTLQAGLALRLNPGRVTGPDKTRDPAPLAVAPPAPRKPESRVQMLQVPPQLPPPPPAGVHPMEDVLTRVSRALVMAGIEAPLFEIAGDEAQLTASFAPASAPRESLRAAYIVFANLPARFDRLMLRNRIGDAVGEEGQVFTRKRVADFARADAAFDQLITAGGVEAVTLEGQAVEVALSGRGMEGPEIAAAVSALSLEPAPEAPPAMEEAPPSAPAAPGDSGESGRRYMPLFGYVDWSGPVDDGRPRADDRMEALEPALADAVFARARAEGLVPVRAGRRGNVVHLAVENDRFRHPATAIGRAARALDPVDATWVEIATLADGAEISRVRFLKDDFARAAHTAGSPEEVWVQTVVDRSASDWSWDRDGGDPRFAWGLYPELLQHFGNGREDGHRAGLYATAAARARLWAGLSLEVAGSREIAGNLDRISAATGPEPHVRSDVARYADEGKWALTTARADYTLRPLGNLYLRASAGIFERMYGGLGLEALVAPQDSQFALGLDVSWVKQRDFDQLLDFRDYSTWTGQMSLYHLSRRHGIRTAIHAGRYLAGDWGATLDLSREFENGVRIGAWITVTDYGRSAFGSDSYAKGLYLTVPFDLALPWSSRRDLPLDLRVLNRDGGQRLHKGAGLYETVAPGSEQRIERSWHYLMK